MAGLAVRWKVLLLLAGHTYAVHGAPGPSPLQCISNPPGPLAPDLNALSCPRVVDDTSSSWAPWTDRPECVRSKKDPSVRYCAFTFSPFRGQAGLSIMTTPEIAASAADLLPDPDPRWEHERMPAYWIPSTPWPYEIGDVPGKGRGAVANRTIRAGEVVLRELPVLVTLMEEPRGVGARGLQTMLERGFERLPRRERKRVLQMARSHGGHVIEDAMRTNVFGIFLHDVDHSGLYPEIGRMNHACRPNMFSRFSRRTLMLEVVAYRDIQPGEELTISYVPLNLLHADRRHLLRGWGFSCTCALCTSPADLAASDRSRRRVQAILDELRVEETRTRAQVEALSAELMGLLEGEHLGAQVGDFAEMLAKVHLQMGDLARAREWAETAVRKQVHYKGCDSEPAERMRRFAEALEGWE